MFPTHHLTRWFLPTLGLAAVTAATFGQDSEPTSTVKTEAARAIDPEFELGLVVTDSPGQGVLVKHVVWGGRAARYGIRAGDFIMALNDQPIQEPTDLVSQLQSVTSSDKVVKISIWRDGDVTSRRVAIDWKFSDTARDKAWLGVMLETTQGNGVLIADVMPASPAALGGIRVGDTVLRMNAENVDSVDELLALMNEIKAGDNVEVTVLRNGQERTFTVRVGSALRRTMRWFEDNIPFQRLEQRLRGAAPEVEMDPYIESFERLIDRLREEISELHHEVQRLREGDSGAGDAETDDGIEEDESESVSTIDARSMPVVLARGLSRTRPRSYSDYRGGRPQARYRYNYRRQSASPRIYYRYYPPFYRYPTYAYPNTMYYVPGPGIRVYYGPAVFWY